MAKDQRRPQRLRPVGDTSMMNKEQLAYIQAYMFVIRWLPSGSLNAHNAQVLTDRIHGMRSR